MRFLGAEGEEREVVLWAAHEPPILGSSGAGAGIESFIQLRCRCDVTDEGVVVVWRVGGVKRESEEEYISPQDHGGYRA